MWQKCEGCGRMEDLPHTPERPGCCGHCGGLMLPWRPEVDVTECLEVTEDEQIPDPELRRRAEEDFGHA